MGSRSGEDGQVRVSTMLEVLGLSRDGRPREQWSASLLRQPATSTRYQPNLVQAQREMRAEEAKRAPSGSSFAPLPRAKRINQPTSLPKLLLPQDQARAIDYKRQGVAVPKQWEAEHRATLAADEAPQNSESDGRHPGTVESMIPIWGSGREAYADFEDGEYVEAAGNALMAVSDVFLAKAVLTGLAKGAVKAGGSHSWGATRKWMGKRGYLQPGQAGHHWLFSQGGWGRRVPDWIKNQPWNIKGMKSRVFHDGVHGIGERPFGPVGRVWHGSPAWPKANTVSVGGRLVPDNDDE